jgi:hypothetical protein
MKFLTLLLAILPLSLGFARQQAIPNSTSPDQRYSLVTAEENSRVFYKIVDTSGDALLAIPSSYQPEKGETGDFAWKQSLAPTINWRKDSKAVVIDEQNYRWQGTLHLAVHFDSAFKEMIFPDLHSLMQLTGKPWERGRLYFEAWDTGNRVRLGVEGRVRNLDNFYEDASSELTISLRNGKVMHVD